MALENFVGPLTESSGAGDPGWEAAFSAGNGVDIVEVDGIKYLDITEDTASAAQEYAAYSKRNAEEQIEDLGAGTHYYDVLFTVVAATSTTAPQCILRVMRVAGSAAQKFEIRQNNDRQLSIWNSAGVQIGSTDSTQLTVGQEYRLQVTVGDSSTSSATDGPYEVVLDGTTLFTGTAALHDAATGVVRLGVGFDRNSTSTSGHWRYRNLMTSSSGYPARQAYVARMDVDGDGTYTSWTADGGGTRFSKVDDWAGGTADDGDTTTISDTQVDASAKVSFTLESTLAAGIPFGAEILAIKLVALCMDSTTAVRSICLLARSNGTDTSPADELAGQQSTTYGTLERVFETDAGNGDVAFTTTILDAFEAGLIDVATIAHTAKCTAFAVMVLFIPPQNVTPSGIASTVAFGMPTKSTSVTRSATGLASTAALGAPTVTPSVNRSATGIPSSAAIGTPATATSVNRTAPGIASTAAFGTPAVLPSVARSAVGIASTAALGTPTIAPSVIRAAEGIASTVAFGVPVVLTESAYRRPYGIFNQRGEAREN